MPGQLRNLMCRGLDARGRRNLRETLPGRHRNGFDSFWQCAGVQPPQQRVERQLVLSVAERARLPINQAGTIVPAIEHGIHGPTENQTLSGLHFDEDLGRPKPLVRPTFESVIEVSNLSDHATKGARPQSDGADLHVHALPDLLATRLVEVGLRHLPGAQMSGEHPMCQVAFERDPGVGRVFAVEPRQGLIRARPVGGVHRRRDGEGVAAGYRRK